MSWNGATSFHIYKTNMKNDIYQDILEEHAMDIEDTYGGREVNFQQDSHTAHGNVEILEGYPNIELLGFLTYSPDLNPIENLWSALKYRGTCEPPRTEAALVRNLHAHWEEPTQVENLRPYFQTLEGCFSQYIEKGGEDFLTNPCFSIFLILWHVFYQSIKIN